MVIARKNLPQNLRPAGRTVKVSWAEMDGLHLCCCKALSFKHQDSLLMAKGALVGVGGGGYHKERFRGMDIIGVNA